MCHLFVCGSCMRTLCSSVDYSSKITIASRYLTRLEFSTRSLFFNCWINFFTSIMSQCHFDSYCYIFIGVLLVGYIVILTHIHVCQRIQYAKTKSDVVAKADGTFVPREKRKRHEDKGKSFIWKFSRVCIFFWIHRGGVVRLNVLLHTVCCVLFALRYR